MLCIFNDVEFKEKSGRFIMADCDYFLVMGLDRDNKPVGIYSFDMTNMIGDCVHKYGIETQKRIEIAGLSFFVDNEDLKYPESFIAEVGVNISGIVQNELGKHIVNSLFGDWGEMIAQLHKVVRKRFK